MVSELGALDLGQQLELKIFILANHNIRLHTHFMSPLMFDILNIQTWKVKMSMYLKALGIPVYFATIKVSYYLNGKYLEANAKPSML